MKNEVQKRERWIHETNRSLAFLMLLLALRNGRINPYEQIRDLGTRIAKCTEVGGGIFRHFVANCFTFIIYD